MRVTSGLAVLPLCYVTFFVGVDVFDKVCDGIARETLYTVGVQAHCFRMSAFCRGNDMNRQTRFSAVTGGGVSDG